MQKAQAKLKDLLEKVKGFFKKLNRKTLIVLGVCAVVNIFLDLLLVVVFQMAVMGAALATTLSQRK